MNILKLLPVFLSSLLLAAHFLRMGFLLLVLASLGLPVLLFIKKAWAARVVQIALLLGALEWVRSLVQIAGVRIDQGQSWLRMAAILGIVALFTAGAACVFFCRSLKARYKIGQGSDKHG